MELKKKMRMFMRFCRHHLSVCDRNMNPKCNAQETKRHDKKARTEAEMKERQTRD